MLLVTILAAFLYHNKSVLPPVPNYFSMLWRAEEKQVAQEVVTKFDGMKFKHSSRYLVLAIKDENIVVHSVGNKLAGYMDLVHELPENEPRYAVFDAGSEFVFVNWVPDSQGSSKNGLHFLTRRGGPETRRSSQGVEGY